MRLEGSTNFFLILGMLVIRREAEEMASFPLNFKEETIIRIMFDELQVFKEPSLT